MPLVSVLMTVYNEEKYLGDAIDSLLSQTFTDFELVIVDDGSSDKTPKILRSYQAKDSRVKVVSQTNQGVSAACNNGLKQVTGTYVARHDADDISDPTRLEKQVNFMETHADVGLLGSNYHIIDEAGSVIDTTSVFTNSNDLKLAEIFSNQFGQGSIMMRRSALDHIGSYDPQYKIAHDYDLWIRFSQHTNIANLVEPLYSWRSAGVGLSTSPKNIARMEREAADIRNRAFDYYLAHRSYYRPFSLHPRTVRLGVRRYAHMKNTMFRDMAILYTSRGLRRRAVPVLLLALLYQPNNAKAWRQLYYTLLRTSALRSVSYEYI